MISENELPQDWKVIKLKDIFEIKKGKKVHISDNINKNAIPYIGIENLRGTPISQFTFDKKGLVCNKNDILLVWDGANCGTIGTGLSGYVGSTIARLRITSDELNESFAFHYLKSKFHYFNSNTTGATIPHLDKKKVISLSIPLPPLPTQQKIATILEKVERLKEWRKEADRLTDEFLKSTFLEMFEGINNDRFGVKEFKEIVEEFRYGTSKKSEREGFPVLGIPNVLGKELIVDSVNRVNLSESELEKLKLKKFDLLFVRSNGNPNYIGRCGIFNLDEEDYIFASYLIRARIRQEIINPFFLKAYLETSIGRRELRLNCRTTAGQFNINTHGLGSIKIPIPSIKLQNKFANIVHQVGHLREHQSQSKQQIDNLFNALMQKAFKGELAC